MAIEVFNRYEKKYLVTDEQYKQLRMRLNEFMEADAFCKGDGTYSIWNLYYDTKDDLLIRRSIEKPLYKEKLRLRSYGATTYHDKVFLEIKKKYNGRVNKRRTKLTLLEAYEYANTKLKPEYKPYMNKQVLNEIDYMVNFYGLKPKVFIAYDRVALFDKNDHDFRVTFDKNIIARRYDLGLHYGAYGDSLLEDGYWLMEVKIANAMPMYMTKLLSELKIKAVSFSKYGTEYKRLCLKEWNERAMYEPDMMEE
ncbi:MAG: polyphosphate polymerase domain-containing protein [Lachnospiraceae bacterium]|nr:polyphosphate polymerase domain-containing protein [Lachnospiraceae bacterium]